MGFHFLMTLAYTVPGIPVPGFIISLSVDYCAPMFHQGWSLFAPNVQDYQCELYYRYPDEGKWSDWQGHDAIDEISDHRRVGYIVNKLSLKLQNAMTNDTYGLYYVDEEAQYDRVVESIDYSRAIYYAAKHHEYISSEKIDSVQIRLNYSFTPDMYTGEQKDSLNFIFPVYHIHYGH